LRHQGSAYTGINALYLWAIADSAGYRSRYWMTYRQAQELGAQVMRGERASTSIYFNSVNRSETDVATGEETNRVIRFMRSYAVFNADQIEGLPGHFYAEADPVPPPPSEHQAAIDAFFSPIPIEVRHGGDRAFYSPAHDFIQLPQPAAFKSAHHYAGTKAHEMAHATGHSSRLARTFGKRFGDNAYAVEELVAEICAGFVGAELGLPTELLDNHASYLDHWLRILRGDKTAIISAASKAEQAFKWLSSFSAPQAAADDEIADEVTDDAPAALAA
jgi:antirestriction protein ArdC